MKKKTTAAILSAVMALGMIIPAGVSAEEYYEEYYDNGYYEETYYDDGYYDNGYYDDGYYDNGYYDDGYYDNGYYDDGYYDDGYSEESYEEEKHEDTDSSNGEKFQKFTPRTDIARGGAERETPNENGQVHSYLTGKLTDAKIAHVRPMAVMINNIIDALPQCGISKAGVIYEAPVEGDITRMMAIFEDYAGLEKIGPIRSCRDYYIDWAIEFDAMYTHFGQAVYAYDLLNSDMVSNISGLQYQDAVGELNGYAGEDIFFRTDDRPAPHNAYTSYDQLMTAIERKDYSFELADSYSGHFNFAADGETVTYSDGNVTYIQPSLYANTPHFEYDAESQKYLRWEYGDQQIDQMTGEQLKVDNVIIQYCPVQNYDDHGYLDIDTNYGGQAYVFSKGTYTNATWKKSSDWGVARYYDSEGNEIRMNQGTTWVCIVDDSRKSDTEFH